MFICVISHGSCGPLNLYLKLTSLLQENVLLYNLTKSYLYKALYSAKTRHASLLYSWYVLAFRTQFTFPLSWFWHFEYRKPSSSRCTSLTTLFPSWQNVHHLRLERRTSTQFSSIARYFLVNKRTVRICTLFPGVNLSTDITMFYYHIRLCISLANNWELFLKKVSVVSLSFHLVIKGSFS